MSILSLNVVQIALLLIIIGMLLRIMHDRRIAATTARDTKSDASNAASNAARAAEVAKTILDRIETLGSNSRDAAVVVAADLADSQERADAVREHPPGAAADAAMSSPPLPPG